MKTTRSLLSILLVSAPLAAGCHLGGGQGMPLADTQSVTPKAAQPTQLDLRAPSARDPDLRVAAVDPGMSDQMGDQSPAAGGTEAAADPMTEEMATRMKELGAQMKEMGTKMQDKGAKMQDEGAKMQEEGAKMQDKAAMKSEQGTAGKQPAGGAMGAMTPAKRMEMGAQMKEMGAKLQKKGRSMKSEGKAAVKQPAGGGMAAMDPGKMMEMGKEMMGMGDMMMEKEDKTDSMEPGKMAGMGDQMMKMGSAMCCMGPGMSKKKKKSAPMDKTMGTPPPAGAPDQPPADPPMQHE